MSSSSDEESDSIPDFTKEESREVDLLPAHSKEKYLRAYHEFLRWRAENNFEAFSESIFLTYFNELAQTKKPTTLWTTYSMLKVTIESKHKVLLGTYSQLQSFLKKQSQGYKSTKANVFSAEDVETFLSKAPDKIYLAMKVALIFGINGGCGSTDLTQITVDNVQKYESLFFVKLPSAKKKNRQFIIRGEHAKLVQKYIDLRPKDVETNRFFLKYHAGKCVKQVIGKNKLSTMPKAIASYLNLPNLELFRGHSFRTMSTESTHVIETSGGYKNKNDNETLSTTQQQSEVIESGPSEEIQQIQWQLNESNTNSNEAPTKVKSLLAINRDERKALKRFCKIFQLDPELPLEVIKEEVRLRKSHQDVNVDFPKAHMCTSIYISEMPLWCKFFDVKVLIMLHSEFDVECDTYYIDMFKDDQNKCTGKCLLRFTENKDCLQVYRDLQGIYLNEGPVLVTLDLGHEIANEREINQSFEEKLRELQESRARYKQNYVEEQEVGTSNQMTIKEVIVAIKREIDDTDNHKETVLEGATDCPTGVVEGCTNIPIEVTIEGPTDNPLHTVDPLIKQEELDFTDDIVVSFDTQSLGCPIKLEDNENLIDMKQDPVDDSVETVTLEAINESNDLNIEENNKPQDTPQETAQGTQEEITQDDLLLNSGDPENNYFYYYNKCTVIHIKNIPSNITYNCIFLIKDLLINKTGVESKFQYTKVTDNAAKIATDILLQFESHEEAVTACSLLDGVTILGNKIEATMGLGYTFSKDLTPKDLQLFERKRKMINDWDVQSACPSKKIRLENINPSETPAVDYKLGFMPTEMCTETFGLSREFLGAHGLQPPFTCRIIVSHLHPEVNEAKLFEVFSLAGDVKKVHLSIDINGVYQAKIEYDHPLEAIQAVSMFHKQKLYDEEMKVQMDKSRKEKPLPLGLASIGQGLGLNGLPLKGVRIEAEMRKVHERFVTLGIMEKSINTYKRKKKQKMSYPPFRFTYRTCKVKDAAKPSTTNVPSTTPLEGYSNQESNYQTMQTIMAGLQKKPADNQNLNPKPNPNPNINNMNIVSTSLNVQQTPANINPILNPSLDDAINRVMQFMGPQSSQGNPLQFMGQNLRGNLPQAPFATTNLPQAPFTTRNVPQAPYATNLIQPVQQNYQSTRDSKQSRDSVDWDCSRGRDREESDYKSNRRSVDREFRRSKDRERDSRRSRDREWRDRARRRSKGREEDYRRRSSRDRDSNYSKRSRDREEKYSRSSRVSEEKNYRRSRDREESSRNSRYNPGQSKQTKFLVFSNLPPSVTIEGLRKKMKEIGDVDICEMSESGCAVVRFMKQQDADRCIRSFHQAKVDGQVINVVFM